MISRAPIETTAGVKVHNFVQYNKRTWDLIMSFIQDDISCFYVKPFCRAYMIGGPSCHSTITELEQIMSKTWPKRLNIKWRNSHMRLKRGVGTLRSTSASTRSNMRS